MPEGQAGASLEVTQEMKERVLDVLRASGLCDGIHQFDAPLAERLCRTVIHFQPRRD